MQLKSSVLFLFILIPIFAFCNVATVTVSGIIKESATKAPLGYVNVVLKTEKDSVFVTGTVTNEEGRFVIPKINPGNYVLEISFIGYKTN